MRKSFILGMSLLCMILIGNRYFSFHQHFWLTSSEATQIGLQIWANECAQKVEGLTCWNKGEEFASLGIGHFIWYPEGSTGPFKQTFPDFLRFLKEEGTALPIWLESEPGCPWQSRDEFYQDEKDPRLKELRQLLMATIDKQLFFMINRLDRALPGILRNVSEDKKETVARQFYRLATMPAGLYALVDYTNFKGEGLADKECYQGKRWGLKQVLEQMPAEPADPVEEFVTAAKLILSQRVEASPPERNEQRWLKGWHNRLDTYLRFAQ